MQTRFRIRRIALLPPIAGDAAAGLPLLLVMLMGASCAPTSVAQTPVAQTPIASSPVAPARATLILAIGVPQVVPNTDVTVAFEAVGKDSRCPAGTTCFWAGDAAVKIQLSAPGVASVAATLHTNLDSAREAAYNGLQIRLVDVTPMPSAEGKPRLEDYRVTLSIQRK